MLLELSRLSIPPGQRVLLESVIRGKKRLDLTVDLPPDLALEINITSRTYPSIYQAFGVPELWRFDRGKLQINLLQHGKYVEVENSPTAPAMPLKEAILRYLEQSRTAGRNATMKAFRQWVRENKSLISYVQAMIQAMVSANPRW